MISYSACRKDRRSEDASKYLELSCQSQLSDFSSSVPAYELERSASDEAERLPLL
jgi:hypothetical protein